MIRDRAKNPWGRIAFRHLALGMISLGLAASAAMASTFERREDGVALTLGDSATARYVEVTVCRDDVFRVQQSSSPDFFDRETLMTDDEPCRPTDWELQTGDHEVILWTTTVGARIKLSDGAFALVDREGRTVFAERPGSRTVTPAVVQGEETHHVGVTFQPAEGEEFYGLGQHQEGDFGYRGRSVDLFQSNTVASVPFLVSSRGYGVLWNNPSRTRVGDPRDAVPIPPANLLDADGDPGGLTATIHRGSCDGPVVATRVDAEVDLGAPEDRPAVSAVHSTPQATASDLHPNLEGEDACALWEGEIRVDSAGTYEISTFSNNGIRVWFDDTLRVDTWRQGWLAWWDRFRVELDADSRHRIRIEWTKNQGEGTVRLRWKTPPWSRDLEVSSRVGDGIDYTVIYGPELDRVIAGYREITGRAPMMPRWAFGLWQSRERYESAAQGLEVAAEFRKREIPFDILVQDWRYWPDGKWGSHHFDPERFPDPKGWIEELHDEYHARLMISVWPKFHVGTENFEELRAAGVLYPTTLDLGTEDWLGHVHSFYDAFSPQARSLFWRQLDRDLFSLDVDAWWLDATEPELVGEGTAEALEATMNPTAIGSGARVANAYALVAAQTVYEGQRSIAPDQRVFILTRSAFAGSQRYAAATWSGDISSDWASFAKQIPAGLNLALSGIPYWTTDIGGFAVPPRWASEDPAPEDVEEWRELVTRWYQFGTFSPLLRSHGQHPPREPWFFGDEEHPAYRTQVAFDRLRYRMLPYVYSLAAGVTRHHQTLMRALVMDFPHDPAVKTLGDQFLFGPAFLVNPVTHPGATEREVYLPRGADWYDFWTGNHFAGGRTLLAPAPLESLPLYIRAGSILPMGPELQYTDEKPADPVTLWVYEGENGSFELYEDDGTSYAYERGEFATIPLRWDDTHRALVIGNRSGSFPGMLRERTFRVVFVSPESPLGHRPEPEVATEVMYDGATTTVVAPPAGETSPAPPPI